MTSERETVGQGTLRSGQEGGSDGQVNDEWGGRGDAPFLVERGLGGKKKKKKAASGSHGSGASGLLTFERREQKTTSRSEESKEVRPTERGWKGRERRRRSASGGCLGSGRKERGKRNNWMFVKQHISRKRELNRSREGMNLRGIRPSF